MRLEFGVSVPAETRAADAAQVARYAQRLSRLTGLSITTGASNPNFTVLVLSEAERRAMGPELQRLAPGISPAALRAVVDMPRSTLCLVLAFSDGGAEYTRALAVVRAEHPDLLRLSCYHEEIAQGLGLANDSPAARPSIFNDDEEFGLLTTQDELLLRLLYDPELAPGMTFDQAEPIVRRIASELLP